MQKSGIPADLPQSNNTEKNLDQVQTAHCILPHKFTDANQKLGTQMKATGEVMSVGRTFEESLLKAIRSLETGVIHLYMKEFEKEDKKALMEYIKIGTVIPTLIFADTLAMGYPLAFDANAEERDTRGLSGSRHALTLSSLIR